MILSALVDYYNRCRRLYPDEVAPLGFESKELEFVIHITQDGTPTGEILSNVKCIVARPPSNKTGIKAPTNLLYDSAKYMLNVDDKSIKNDEYTVHCQMVINMLVELVKLYPNRKDFSALLRFYKDKKYQNKELTKQLTKKILNSKSISFIVKGYDEPVCTYSKETDDYLHKKASKEVEGLCLVTGDRTNICKTFGSTPFGIADNGKLVSFDKNKSYESYGKQQGANAPISIYAEYAYMAALKRLVNSEDNQLDIKAKKNKNGKLIYMTDRKLLFWSSVQTKEDIEKIEKPVRRFMGIKKRKEEINPDDIREVKDFFEKVRRSGINNPYRQEKYYFLELVPTSKGREAISYWSECSLDDFAKIVQAHYEAMNLETNREIRYDAGSMVKAVFAYKKDEDKIEYNSIPNLIDAVFRSVLRGDKYPEILYKMALNRIMSEQTCPDKKADAKGYYFFEDRDAERAAICKAYLIRNLNYNYDKMINEEIKDKGYLCGRLFAVLEYTQQKANYNKTKEWKSDLRSKYMNAAMTAPATVFPAILTNSNYYLDMLAGSTIDYIEDIKKQIFSRFEAISTFPTVLTTAEQGSFFFGYYQQKQELNGSKKDITNSQEEANDNTCNDSEV